MASEKVNGNEKNKNYKRKILVKILRFDLMKRNSLFEWIFLFLLFIFLFHTVPNSTLSSETKRNLEQLLTRFVVKLGIRFSFFLIEFDLHVLHVCLKVIYLFFHYFYFPLHSKIVHEQFNDPFNCEINDFARNLFELLKIWSNKDRKLTALGTIFGHLVRFCSSGI